MAGGLEVTCLGMRVNERVHQHNEKQGRRLKDGVLVALGSNLG